MLEVYMADMIIKSSQEELYAQHLIRRGLTIEYAPQPGEIYLRGKGRIILGFLFERESDQSNT